jgi:hypothetical protein
LATTREAASEEEAEELKALDALSGYRSDGRSLPEGHPAKDWQARPVCG